MGCRFDIGAAPQSSCQVGRLDTIAGESLLKKTRVSARVGLATARWGAVFAECPLLIATGCATEVVVQTVVVEREIVVEREVEIKVPVEVVKEVPVVQTVVVEKKVNVPVPQTVIVEREVEILVVQTVIVEKEVIKEVSVEFEAIVEEDETTSGGDAPHPISYERPIIVAAGANHGCGIKSNETLTCWGKKGRFGYGGRYNLDGQVDPPDGKICVNHRTWRSAYLRLTRRRSSLMLGIQRTWSSKPASRREIRVSVGQRRLLG